MTEATSLRLTATLSASRNSGLAKISRRTGSGVVMFGKNVVVLAERQLRTR